MQPQERFDRVTTPSGVAADRRHAMRLVRDNEDFVLVYELSGVQPADARSLVIEWNGGRQNTRLTQYPSNWRQLRDAELLALRPLQDA